MLYFLLIPLREEFCCVHIKGYKKRLKNNISFSAVGARKALQREKLSLKNFMKLLLIFNAV
jgi:hypothetical protein